MKPDATIRIEVAESGDVRLVATDPDDDSTIVDAIDIGRDGTDRRWFILRELVRREGCRIVDAKGKVLVG
ncbi:MAG TPA: hypothetical protein VGH28_14105 [Polyangiaceae bacterium]|jgi:hypothetical protein